MQKSRIFSFVAGGCFAVLFLVQLYWMIRNIDLDIVRLITYPIMMSGLILAGVGMFTNKPVLTMAGCIGCMIAECWSMIELLLGSRLFGYYYYPNILTIIIYTMPVAIWTLAMIACIARRAALPLTIAAAGTSFLMCVIVVVNNGFHFTFWMLANYSFTIGALVMMGLALQMMSSPANMPAGPYGGQYSYDPYGGNDSYGS